MPTFVTRSAVLQGIEAVPINVEVSVHPGVSGLHILGMPDAYVLEAASRVRIAINASGYEMPRANVVVNLAPNDVRKTGAGLDLPIAAAILACTGQIPAQGLDGALLVGELGLQGDVHSVRGTMAYELLAANRRGAFVCAEAAPDARPLSEREYGIRELRQLRNGIDSLDRLTMRSHASNPPSRSAYGSERLDFADVYGQEGAKRALMIAAAGNHNVLMVGPPGSGKAMLARRMPTILPPLSDEKRDESMLVHSVAMESLADLEALRPPFRAPHSSITLAGLLGGGRPVVPGEVSLAHNGVLFLDDLQEFSSAQLQAVAVVNEDKSVSIVRMDSINHFSADFLLVAAANPCPCGHLGDPGHDCVCSPGLITAYQARLGGPLQSHFALSVDVPMPDSRVLLRGERGLSSAEMAEQVLMAREYGAWRTAEMGERYDAIQAASMDDRAQDAFEALSRRRALPIASMANVAMVARTVADMRRQHHVTVEEVIEALSFAPRFSDARARDGYAR